MLDGLVLEIDCVSKTLGAFRLKDVSFNVNANEYFVLLGPTGAGKTVLLEVIMGFHHPDEGRILLDGKDITDTPTEKRGIGYVPQSCPLFPNMSVSENIEFGLKMQRMARVERKKAVERMLEIMGLEEMPMRTPSTLSGGERQKVVLARVLVTRPKIVLLDEPLTSIDVQASRFLRKELKRVNRELSVAIVHVTHDQIEAFTSGDEIAVMRNGEVMQLGHPGTVLSNPADEFVARFLGYENVFHVKLVKHEKDTSEIVAENNVFRLAGRLQHDEAVVAVRPENVVVSTNIQSFSEEWNVFDGTITGYVDLGPVIDVEVDAGLTLKALISKRSFLESNLVAGDHVHVGFRVDSVRIVGNH